MGNYVSCAPSNTTSSESSSSPAAKVILPDGGVRNIHAPTKAAELMMEMPSHFLVDAKSLKMGRKLTPQAADDDLKLGDCRVYVAFHMTRVASAANASDMARLFLAGKKRVKSCHNRKVSPKENADDNVRLSSGSKLNLEDIEDFLEILTPRNSVFILFPCTYILTDNSYDQDQCMVVRIKIHRRNMARSLKKSVKLSLRHVRIRSSTISFKPESNSIERDQRIEFLGGDNGVREEENNCDSSSEYEEFEDEGVEGDEEEQDDGKSVVSGGKTERKETEVAVGAVEAAETEITEAGNRVMVVVDKVIASTGALEWALKHTLQSQDYLFLLYFSKPFRKGKRKNRKLEVKTDELVHTLKKLCQTKRPGIEVEIRRLEGKEKEKGEKIVEEAKEQQVSLLVVGEEKKPPVWRLVKRWGWKKRRGRAGVLKYCLEKASCMTIAVKPKSRKFGGYLITTKRHKNFWLLA